MMAEPDNQPQLQDWEVLQKKIFTRWVNQKLMSQHKPLIDDVLTDIGKDDNLVNLLSVLSEKDPPAQPHKKKIVAKAQMIEQMDKALQFVWSCGVDMKLKPSPENLMKGDFKDVMALIWAIMMKYIKFDDDDEESQNLSAKDALLKWFKFHTKGYKHVNVTNLTKSFHDGMAFCALLHKYFPNEIDYDSLDPADKQGNLQLAMDKAEELIGLEKYLTPADVPKLDEKSMLVYCSEYFYCINEQAKRALAAKRISKLISFTKTNDAMKEKYVSDGEVVLQHITRSEQLLSDVETIDNTMAGARQRLDNFTAYKQTEKQAITRLHLDMEAQYNTLALRLANHSRPAFKPSNAELEPTTLASRIKQLQAKEVVEPQLHAELNRQIRLQHLNERHQTLSSKLTAWTEDKKANLAVKAEVTSSGQARQLLNALDSLVSDLQSQRDEAFAELTQLGAELASEKYENTAEVKQREEAIKSGLADVQKQADEKRPVLEDDLARELFKEKVRLQVQIHNTVHDGLHKWYGEKKKYLEQRETIDSVQAASLQISLLQAFEQEQADTEAGSFKRLLSLGQEIRDAKYETQYSTWVYEDPASISQLEESFQKELQDLSSLCKTKREWLDDSLAREQFKEQTELLVGNHTALHQSIVSWVDAKKQYLSTKEDLSSSAEARYQLSVLEAYSKEKSDMTEGAAASLKKLGEQIRTAQYKTALSEWVYPKPNDVKALEDEVDKLWAELDAAHDAKKAVLEDDLARELYAEETRLLAGQHQRKQNLLEQWAKGKKTFLDEPISVNSIADAQVLLGQLESYEKEKATVTDSLLKSLKSLGQTVLARKYETQHSKYVYEEPDTIKELEQKIDQAWSELDATSAQRKKNLEEALAREQRKEELRLKFADLSGQFVRYCTAKVESLGTKEEQKVLFGFNLAEVEAYNSKLSQDDQTVDATLAQRMEAIQAVKAEMDQLQVTENPYTSLGMDDLSKNKADLDQAKQARQAFYQKELERRRQDDALCRQFADLVKPFNATIGKNLAEVLATDGTEESQLEQVEKHLAGLEAVKLDFSAASSLEKQIQSRGVSINPHTTLNTSEVEALWENYTQVLERKKPYLESLIAYKKYRGIEPERFEEMEQIFHEYDKDNSGNINEKELRTAMFSLGEERTKTEITQYMKQYGKNGVLAFEPFRELMVTLLGDAGTRDGVVESFKLISLGHPGVKEDQLSKLLSAEDVGYLKATTKPHEQGGLDFEPWVDDVMSR